MQGSEILDSASVASGNNSPAQQQAVERVIRAMRERLNEPWTLQDLADIAHLSPNYFHNFFIKIHHLL